MVEVGITQCAKHMPTQSYHYNENVAFYLDRYEVVGSELFISGWIFSEMPIERVDLSVGQEGRLMKRFRNIGSPNFSSEQGYIFTKQIESYGLPSNDVEPHYGANAINCRFDEVIELPRGKYLKDTCVFRLYFSTGLIRQMTVRSGDSEKVCIGKEPGPEKKVRLGIGVTTFNRKDSLQKLLEKLYMHTWSDFYLIVADDGSTDSTIKMLREMKIPFITGSNRGVAWNKNRALYYLNSTKSCDVIILLEDDTYPSLDGWEEDWVGGAQKYNHLNLAGHWFKENFLSGFGTIEDPILSKSSSGQCVSFSRKAIERVGYFDTRFGLYGFEHIEHSERCIKLGYGGRVDTSTRETEFLLIRGGVTVGHMMDFHFTELLALNAPIYHAVRNDELHRWAWRGNKEMDIFLAEQDQATAQK